MGTISGTMKMKKAINAFRKPTSVLISANQSFFESLIDVRQVVVCGFSFSSVDMPYVEELINHLPDDVMWRVFVHSDRDKKRMGAIKVDLNLKMENVEW